MNTIQNHKCLHRWAIASQYVAIEHYPNVAWFIIFNGVFMSRHPHTILYGRHLECYSATWAPVPCA